MHDSLPPNDPPAGAPTGGAGPDHRPTSPSASLAAAPRLSSVPRAIRLRAASGFWQVESGAVDLFAVRFEEAADRRPLGAWHPLGQVAAGEAFGGLPPVEDAGEGVLALEILAVPQPGAVIRDAAPPSDSLPFAGFDGWIRRIVEAVDPPLRPRDLTAVGQHGGAGSLAAGAAVCSVRDLLWLKASAPLRLCDRETIAAGTPVALSPAIWTRAEADCAVTLATSADLAAHGRLDAVATQVLAAALERMARHLEQAADGETEKIAAREGAAQRRMMAAATQLATTLHPQIDRPDPAAADDPLLRACLHVMAGEGFPRDPTDFRTLPARVGSIASSEARSMAEGVERIARAARVRLRRSKLYPGWWRGDFGSFVAMRAGAPVAVVRAGHAYRLIGPDGRAQKVDAALAETLAPEVYLFYRPFPDGPLNGWSLLRFAVSADPASLATILLAAAAAALLALLTPLISAEIFDVIVPDGNYGALEQVTLVLAGAAIGNLGFSAAQALSQLRLQGRVDAVVQSAVWDRLLNLPASFFRNYEVGDLASRASGINALSAQITGAMMSSLFGGVFAMASFAMMLVYQWQLALVGLAFVAITLGGSVAFAVVQRRFQREQLAIRGELAARIFQYIAGIAKLRTAGAERFAFWDWSRRFARDVALQRRSGKIVYSQGLFSSGMMLLFQGVSLLLFAFVLAKVSIGGFIAFNAAFGQFFSGLSSFSGALVALYGLAPLYERTRPILEAAQEIDDGKADPGDLTGHIELDAVSFHYPQASRPVLDDIHLTLQPGEFVAIVGASGAGKSTLLRLLLGFEQPSRGTVSYDGRDLATLDPTLLRRQIGVVLQNGQILPGSIFENIVANGPFSLDEAWRAADMAGIAGDIRAMPMGMQTMISEGAVAFSGGQKQRLLIARALIRRPRILFLDEATSALDNLTQAHITAALKELRTTRVVIAHRLSTILGADRIIVLDGGRIVQEGTYAALMNGPGPFATLAQRQLA